MDDIAIRVDNLGKQYSIGGPQARYKTIRESLVEAVQAFFLLYMFSFLVGSFGLAVIAAIWGPDMSIVATVSAVASSLGNVGPGLESVGPTGNYHDVPMLGKWLLAALMIVGRLEILPVVILFNRESWRR